MIHSIKILPLCSKIKVVQRKKKTSLNCRIGRKQQRNTPNIVVVAKTVIVIGHGSHFL